MGVTCPTNLLPSLLSYCAQGFWVHLIRHSVRENFVPLTADENVTTNERGTR
jgi:hypothetical protein